MLQGLVSVLEGQLAFPNPAHVGEVHTAALGGQELCQALEFIGPAHETVGGGAQAGCVCGGAVGEFGFGWRRQVGVVFVLVGDELITARAEGSSGDQRADLSIGLLPSRRLWFGRLGSPARQAQQRFPVHGGEAIALWFEAEEAGVKEVERSPPASRVPLHPVPGTGRSPTAW